MKDLYFDEDENSEYPDGFWDTIGKLKTLVYLLYPTRMQNDVQFLVMLSDDINLFRLYMGMINVDKVVDACRYLFMAFPEASQSKKIKTKFGVNMVRKRKRIDRLRESVL